MPGSSILIIDAHRNSCVLDPEHVPVDHKDVTFLFAHSIAQAENLFNEHCKHIAVITVHAFELDQGIHVQGSDRHVRLLRRAGCSWEIEGSNLEAGILHALSTNR